MALAIYNVVGKQRVRSNSVIEMASSASVSALGSEFDDFLYAPIGEDRNEMPLSVLSALARLDIDPWREASELARLPRDTATQRLASLIAELPDWPSLHMDPGAIAARLIALLPRVTRSNIPSRETLLSGGAVTNSRAVIYMILINVIVTIFMLGAQWIAASRQPPAQNNAQAPASTVVFPPLPPPNSGQ
jgi:hypothetical protein